jgi:small subunit ribosomal protein S17
LADEKDNDETPATPDDADRSEIGQPTPDAPEAEAAPAEAAEAEAPAADEPEVAADEPEAAAEEPQAAAAEPDAAPSEPEEQLSPKERRRRTRSKHEGEARPVRTAQQRHDDRQATRKDKAVRRRARRLQERAKAAERRASAPAPDRSEIGQLAPVHAPVEGRRRMRQGIVISDKAAKTITVRIDVARRHRRYEKIVRSSSTLHAHDENNDAHEGDTVRVIESRPLSRSKRWALVDVLERAR